MAYDHTDPLEILKSAVGDAQMLSEEARATSQPLRAIMDNGFAIMLAKLEALREKLGSAGSTSLGMNAPTCMNFAPVDMQTAVELWKWCYTNVVYEAGGDVQKTLAQRTKLADELFAYLWTKFYPKDVT